MSKKKTTDLYDINFYYPDQDSDELVITLYMLYIDQNGHLTTHTEEIYDSWVVPQKEREEVDKWILDTFAIDIQKSDDAWDSVSPTTLLPDVKLAPKTALRLKDLPAYDLQDWRE
jgi:hypothetical protein